MSCLDPQKSLVPQVIKGEDKTLSVRLNDAKTGIAIDLAAASEIEALFLNSDGSYLSKNMSLGQIVLTNPGAGFFQIFILAADTLLLAIPTTTGAYSNIEIHITMLGKKTYVQLKNSIQVLQTLFP
jgi:hypothetical protein